MVTVVDAAAQEVDVVDSVTAVDVVVPVEAQEVAVVDSVTVVDVVVPVVVPAVDVVVPLAQGVVLRPSWYVLI